MLLPSHLRTILCDKQIQDAVHALKINFAKDRCRFTQISDEDFLGLVFMSPNIGVAIADKRITFREEMLLNKKARKLSKGGFLLSKDPIIHYMNRYMDAVADWEGRFLECLRFTLDKLFDADRLNRQFRPPTDKDAFNNSSFHLSFMKMSYLFVKVMESMFFAMTFEELVKVKKYNTHEFAKLKEIGKTLELDKVLVFQAFINTVAKEV